MAVVCEEQRRDDEGGDEEEREGKGEPHQSREDGREQEAVDGCFQTCLKSRSMLLRGVEVPCAATVLEEGVEEEAFFLVATSSCLLDLD